MSKRTEKSLIIKGGADTIRYTLRAPTWLLGIGIIIGIFLVIFLSHQHFFIDVLLKKSIILGITSGSQVYQSPEPKHLRDFGLPTRIEIPKINLNAAVQSVGFTSDGAMDVPTNSVDVGWFAPGPRPGSKGSAVISGHLDSVDGAKGVFANLDTLSPGDVFTIEDDRGQRTSFVVRGSHSYNPGDDVPEVFNQSEGTHLNLITCDGVWNPNVKSYTKRLVVFGDLDQ